MRMNLQFKQQLSFVRYYHRQLNKVTWSMKCPLPKVVSSCEDESSVQATTTLYTVPSPTHQSNLEHDYLSVERNVLYQVSCRLSDEFFWPIPFIIVEKEDRILQRLRILPMLPPRRLESIREEMSIEIDKYLPYYDGLPYYDERSI